MVIIIAVVVVGLAVSLAFVTHRPGTSTTNATSTAAGGFPGYPSTLPASTILEDGSSLLYITFLAWVENFTEHYPNVHITVGASGSGTGQSEVEQNTINIGASDAYFVNQQAEQYPNILNIPVAVSSQTIDYNVPGIPSSMHLNFTGPILAQIYNGTITYWDNPQIIAINPGAANLLTHQQIVPMTRADASGDTFIFTQYLSDTDPAWNKSVGYGVSVGWPYVAGEQGQSGNSGMVIGLASYPYSIGYVGIAYLSPALVSNLGYGYLQNQAGNFVNASSSNIQSDVNQFASNVPTDERISMIDGPGSNSYPIVNFEYVLVQKMQNNTDQAQVIKTFLQWVINPKYGNSASFLDYVSFLPLPSNVEQLSLNQINEIT